MFAFGLLAVSPRLLPPSHPYLVLLELPGPSPWVLRGWVTADGALTEIIMVPHPTAWTLFPLGWQLAPQIRERVCIPQENGKLTDQVAVEW